MKAKLSNIFCIIGGIVFILSGIGKMFDATQFANLITDYGFGYLSLTAPVIILAELAIGLCLLLRFERKKVLLLAGAMLLVFTIAYFYAHTIQGVTNCGCFGNIKQLEFAPVAVYSRNVVLLGMFAFAFFYLPQETNNKSVLPITVFSLIMLFSAFYTGYTFQGEKKKGKLSRHPLIEKPVKETMLPEFYTFHSDSTYAICVFSYRCSNCWNYMENLNRYSESPEIDHVIAFAAGEDTNNEFAAFFKPAFKIQPVDEAKISKLTPVSPTVLYIQNDTIRHVIQGIVPSIYRFEKDYLND